MATFGSQTGKLAPQAMLGQRYKIVQLAGRGGMSAIYQAIDTQQGQKHVAIKEMSLENLDPLESQDAIARFQQEAHLLGTLNHPNLTRVYDAFNEGGRSFLVMDYIDGKTLLQLLQIAKKPLPYEQVMRYAEQLCDVLTYLHQHNPPIIFRDLKPTNVMVTKAGQIYLIDFGIARFFKEGQHQDTIALGSPGYAPPEQHGSGQTNPRSDLYALGATLHCCLSNRDPYHATDRFAFAPVRQFNPQVPEALDQLILHMVALDEKQRPTSAQAVKQSIVSIRQQIWDQSNKTPGALVDLASISSVPTQPMQSPQPVAYRSTMPAINPSGQNGRQEKPIMRSVLPPSAPPGNGYSSTHHPALSPAHPQNSEVSTTHTRVWTPGFIIAFLLLLALTLGGTVLTFYLPNPYSTPLNPDPPRLNHILETALVVLALLICLLNLVTTRSAIAILTILVSGLALLAAGAAFLVQTLGDISNSALALPQDMIDELFTVGLLAAGVISLFWLLHQRLNWNDRFWLVLFFSIASLCAYVQTLYTSENDLSKQFLLLAALIILTQGVLVAGQMVRKRR